MTTFNDFTLKATTMYKDPISFISFQIGFFIIPLLLVVLSGGMS
jgi:hypothetical protein